MTDRGFWVTARGCRLNVRRLMYQTLIWPAVPGDDARRLGASFDAEDVKRLANPLVDGVRGNAELGGDLFRIEMLIDEAQAVELTGGEPGNPLSNNIVRRRTFRRVGGFRHARRLLQSQSPAKHFRQSPEQRVRAQA
jgi:hypothetical protein